MFFSDFFQKQRSNIKSDFKFTPEEEGAYIQKYFEKYFDGASSFKNYKNSKTIESQPINYSIYTNREEPNAFDADLVRS